MDFKNFTAGVNDEGKRIDKMLRILIPQTSLTEIYRLIRKKFIKINNHNIKENYRIKNGDVISIPSFIFSNCEDNKNTNAEQFCQKENVKSENKKNKSLEQLEIVFENNHILIINKPYDISVHGDKNSLEKKVQNYFLQKQDYSLTFKSGPLHRLDKKTTGLMAFSMSLEGARWFSQNIQNHKIQKTYYTILQGKAGAIHHQDLWSDYIENNYEQQNSFYIVNAYEKNEYENRKDEKNTAKKAELLITPLAYGKYEQTDVTFARIHLISGRKHQIRAQSAMHGYPLLGDSSYGSHINLKKNRFTQDFYLQSAQMDFPQNNLNIPLQIKISLSNDFKNILKSCSIQKTDI